MNRNIKFYIGPMSKIIVDAVLEYDNEAFAFIPSRRQIDFDNGYVNNWNTKTFYSYVKKINPNFIICRDHAGPNQGTNFDDGIESIKEDSRYFDTIHIDPWIYTKDIHEGTILTAKLIETCLSVNDNIKFEIATEESIKYFDSKELAILCEKLNQILNKEQFEKITHLVIQSGTKLKENKQLGVFSEQRLKENVELAKQFKLLNKEHNGDYISNDIIRKKFDLGLQSINIAPEFGLIQTESIIQLLNKNKIDKFFDICLQSGKWKKWVDDNFDPMQNKIELIKISGHYVFSNKRFTEEVFDKSFENHIKDNIRKKLNSYINDCLN